MVVFTIVRACACWQSVLLLDCRLRVLALCIPAGRRYARGPRRQFRRWVYHSVRKGTGLPGGVLSAIVLVAVGVRNHSRVVWLFHGHDRGLACVQCNRCRPVV